MRRGNAHPNAPKLGMAAPPPPPHYPNIARLLVDLEQHTSAQEAMRALGAGEK